ncbi:MAG: UDP-N-acetylglucosamine 1-carboxyvinyltransferase [Bacilli bacterium]|nr:UDP-N-acetylglucosamine 1-carboxyvinyltransferase [Bacilli bacterium]
MKQIEITGNTQNVSGEVKISGAKNAVVALIPAAILSDNVVKITNVANLSDCTALEEILKELNCDVIRTNDTFVIGTENMEYKSIPTELSKKLRASYYFMGALLAKYGKVEIGLPGGCDFGTRPIDLHLKGFEKMGANITVEEDGRVLIEAPHLHGADINFEKVSVGATVNILLAAAKADGVTTISNAAREPEIDNVIDFLNNMGAKIEGKGTSTLKITGVKKLTSAEINVIPDRIETGTFMILGALKGENLKITNTNPEYVESLTKVLKECGVDLQINDTEIIVNKSNNLKPITIETNPYPDFPTDLGQILAILMTQAPGRSKLIENIYSERTKKYLKHLEAMGAIYDFEHNVTTIDGPTPLLGATVEATDLRAGAAFLVAASIAEGNTIINNADLILRGYSNIIDKLTNIGVNVNIRDIKEKDLHNSQNNIKILTKTKQGA